MSCRRCSQIPLFLGTWCKYQYVRHTVMWMCVFTILLSVKGWWMLYEIFQNRPCPAFDATYLYFTIGVNVYALKLLYFGQTWLDRSNETPWDRQLYDRTSIVTQILWIPAHIWAFYGVSNLEWKWRCGSLVEQICEFVIAFYCIFFYYIIVYLLSVAIVYTIDLFTRCLTQCRTECLDDCRKSRDTVCKEL